MNAQEARKKAESLQAKMVKEQYESIKKEIEICVNAGKFQFTYQYSLYDATKTKLLREGYNIKPSYNRNEDFIIIS